MEHRTKVYLAARYSRHPEMQRYAKQLEALGVEITSRWIYGGHEMPSSGEEPCGQSAAWMAGTMPQWAFEDWLDVKSADLVLNFTEDPAQPQGRGRGGRHVECGLAIAWNIPCWVIGPREHIFHWLPQVQVFATWDEAVEHLAAIRASSPGWTRVG